KSGRTGGDAHRSRQHKASLRHRNGTLRSRCEACFERMGRRMTAAQKLAPAPLPASSLFVTKTITDGNGITHFFEVYGGEPVIISKGPPIIALPPPVIGTAMVFIPLATSVVEQAPMLVYYHGHNSSTSIEDYIKALKYRDFRPLLKSKKVLFVAPWGGTRSKFGDLGTSAGLARLIDQAMSAALRLSAGARRVVGPTPRPPSLILSGFSGGGATLKNVVIGSKGDYIQRLTEAWCLDCMYSGEGQAWFDWATTSRKTLRVRVSTEEGTGSPRAQADVIRNALKQKPAPNIDIEKTTEAGHEQLPGLFIQGWLSQP